MSKEISKHNKLKLVSAIGLCSFSLVAVVVSTVAWFTAYRKADNENNNTTIITPTGILDYISLHQLKAYDYVNKKYQFDQTAVGTATVDEQNSIKYDGDFTIEMGTYDDLEQHHPILMLIHLNKQYPTSDDDDTVVNIYASANTTTYFGIEGTDEDGNPTGEPATPIQPGYIQEGEEVVENPDKNPLSSVVQFWTLPMIDNSESDVTTELNYHRNDTDSTYDYEMPQLLDDADNHYTNASFVKFNGYEFSEFVQNRNIYTRTDEDVEYIAVIVDYYHEAIEYVYSKYIGYEPLDDRIFFACDWNMVI